MPCELIINAASYETRVALVEDGHVAEFYIERRSDKTIVGNIYKGRVVKILPGMQSAFVDIGLPKAAFLYVGDVCFTPDEVFMDAFVDEMENGVDKDEGVSLETGFDRERPSCVPIEDRLREGQEILVQISKEPLGNKGARVTTHLTIPGRHLVLMPMVRHVGVSRRIEDETERENLREMVRSMKPPEYGFIVRTAAEGADREKLKAEMEFLLKLWEGIQKRAAASPVPSLVHRELDIVLRAVRDLFTREVERVVVDSEREYNRIIRFVDSFMPSLKYSVELYNGSRPIFEAYGIDVEIQRALNKKVWLKSGGYIVIETTEALTAIDVNTGRYVGKRNFDETILKTNLEAVKEIAYQLRLRNIGGIIIIDFIDMEKGADRERVFQALVEAVKKDRSKTKVLRMSDFGLVEMTRKRTRESLARLLQEPCPYCDGTGYVKSRQTVCHEILRALERERKELLGRKVLIRAHPDVVALFYDDERQAFEEAEEALMGRIYLKGEPDFHVEQYTIEPLDASTKEGGLSEA
ncbi:Rne/Rng family ribonuclease [Thermodesulforhabdus norvegica]|uniref:Ribonuclease G n=1 Tax=Thermodesulforhabdus norvegica TaxID=39841 RepID=A0A1I4TFI4_9BACT|nr:Rne/Rng family ribonuclease [Thermodesulforhabdus norvegica]SFM75383.1 RNAse G [Thermodesulforhabdus norvegica]